MVKLRNRSVDVKSRLRKTEVALRKGTQTYSYRNAMNHPEYYKVNRRCWLAFASPRAFPGGLLRR